MELRNRKIQKMPPYSSMTMILCSSPNEERAKLISYEIFEKLNKFCVNKKKYFNNNNLRSEHKNELNIVGPIEAPIKKIRNRFRWQIFLKSNNQKHILYR